MKELHKKILDDILKKANILYNIESHTKNRIYLDVFVNNKRVYESDLISNEGVKSEIYLLEEFIVENLERVYR